MVDRNPKTTKLAMERRASSVGSLSTLLTLVLAGALLEQAEELIDRGIHPIRIADGFDQACKLAVETLDNIADTFEFSKDNTLNLFKAAKTSLGSKMYTLPDKF